MVKEQKQGMNNIFDNTLVRKETSLLQVVDIILTDLDLVLVKLMVYIKFNNTSTSFIYWSQDRQARQELVIKATNGTKDGT